MTSAFGLSSMYIKHAYTPRVCAAMQATRQHRYYYSVFESLIGNTVMYRYINLFIFSYKTFVKRLFIQPSFHWVSLIQIAREIDENVWAKLY